MSRIEFDDESFEETAAVVLKINPYMVGRYESKSDLVKDMKTSAVAHSANADSIGTGGWTVYISKTYDNDCKHLRASVNPGLVLKYLARVHA